jgi:hypothetical protein
MRGRIPASSGLFATSREISVCARLRGGAERTRTSNQAIMSRHRRLGGAAIAGWEDSNLQPNDYQRLALSIDQRPACRNFVHSEVAEGVLRKWPIEFQ